MNTFVKCLAALGAAGLLSLTGCADSKEVRELRAELDEIKSTSQGYAPELPSFELDAPFMYSSSSTRSPFSQPESIVIEQDAKSRSNVRPPSNKNKSHLEQFPIESLVMVGTIQARGGLEALVKDPEGIVYRVRPGMYLGENFGEVQQILLDGIIIYEVIPDGASSWVKSPRTITMKDNSEN